MSALRFRLLTVIALVLVGGVVSQSAGAGSSQARPFVSASNSTAIAALSQWAGARHAPLTGGIGAALRSAAIRSNGVRSLADSSFFADRDVSFGDAPVYSASWADYNADGKLDVLTLGCTDWSCSDGVAKLYRNNGDGSFSEETNAGLPGTWQGVASWADYDSDGYVDVLIPGCSDDECATVATKLYHNNGNGTFSENTRAGLAGLLSVFGEGIATWADYNNDGRLDVLLTGIDSPRSAIATSAEVLAPAWSSVTKLYRNNGDGSFSEDTHAGLPDPLSVWPNSVSWSDYDADGYEDVLISGCSDVECSTFVSRLYHNNENGTFSENTHANLPGVSSFLLGTTPATWGDYDGDGRPDVLLIGLSGAVLPSLDALQSGVAATAIPDYITKLFHNNGDGTFSENTSSGLPAAFIADAAWGDYNSDGRLDILTNGCIDDQCSDLYATLYRNNGDGSFSEDTGERHLSTNIQLAWGDYNSDGRPDILVSDLMWGSNSGIYKNNSTATATPPSPPDGLAAHRTAKREITFYWNASSSKTASGSVGYNLRVGTTPGGSDIVSPLSIANGTRLLPQFGNAEGKTFAKLKKLRNGTYYWSVQAIGADFSGSAFADEQEFTIPANISLELSETTIYACGRAPRSTTVTGTVNPAFDPVATVILKRRFGPHAGWRKFMAGKKTTSSGSFSFGNIGKVVKRSFWVRAMTDYSQENRMVSVSKHVTVKNVASCARKAKK